MPTNAIILKPFVVEPLALELQQSLFDKPLVSWKNEVRN